MAAAKVSSPSEETKKATSARRKPARVLYPARRNRAYGKAAETKKAAQGLEGRGHYECYSIKIREDERGKFYYDPVSGERREFIPSVEAPEILAALTGCNPIPSPMDQRIDSQLAVE